MIRLIIFLFPMVFLISCSIDENEGWAPVARFTLTPDYVVSGESTEVVLDARRSCDALDNPELCDTSEDGEGTPSICPGGITYTWSIPGQQGGVLAGTDSGSYIRVSVKIDRPVRIDLKVVDCDGMESTTYKWLGVTASGE
ncbi:MAG: hypothetical protein JXR95_03120 [Deltaproteobacteria bacterium]|nr:hypothetical protein [Deltaproteobacteria bacterium]